ncbi:MAG: Holliday junction branch migration protein RuvA [Anaerolineales bacterium]|nr:Holliday junction branch migration protein RuvA [Anaerolineales bacterium]
MFANLSGKLIHKSTNYLVIDVGGVGYQVQAPLSTYYELGEEGSDISLRIHTVVREDSITLFGFLTEDEKIIFTHVIQVSGIGPKTGIGLLSGLSAGEFVDAVIREDALKISGVPGIGKKTAERIILELKDKVKKLSISTNYSGTVLETSPLQEDVLSALVNLGYQKNRADKAVTQIIREHSPERFDDLLRKALKELSG